MTGSAWDWAALPHVAAATYQDGGWWPVLTCGISGAPPVRLTRQGHSFSSFQAAYNEAKEIVDRMYAATAEELMKAIPVSMGCGYDVLGQRLPDDGARER
jgi:hypothetical protein